MRTQLNGNPTQHQEPQHNDQGQIESAEAGGIEHREGEEQCASSSDKPDLVAIPHRADGLQNHATLFILSCRPQVDDTCPQVKTV